MKKTGITPNFFFSTFDSFGKLNLSIDSLQSDKEKTIAKRKKAELHSKIKGMIDEFTQILTNPDKITSYASHSKSIEKEDSLYRQAAQMSSVNTYTK